MKSSINVANALNPHYLRLIVLPTEKCNFRCTYCYENFELGKMPSATADALVHHIRRRVSRLDHLQVSWFGGEPLLATDTVLRVTMAAAQLCESNGVSFASDMTTNAYLLTQETSAKLVQAGVKEFQITVDGIESDHDQTRLHANGTGTFQAIYSNLIQILQSSLDVSILLRLHYSGATASRLPEFSRLIARTFGPDPRFKFSLKEIEALGGPNDRSLIRVTTPSHRKSVTLAKQILGLEAATTQESADSYCYAGSANSYVIRSNGRIAKCTVAFSDDRNDVGHLNQDGTLSLDQAKTRAWTEAALSGEPGAMECPINYLPNTQLRPLRADA
jgi:uncharacterized protein